MSFANSSITDIIALTIRNRSKEIFDNVTKNNAVLMKLKQRGNIRTISGGYDILEEISFQENGNVSWYSGYDQLAVAAQDVISAAQYYLKQLACPVTISGLEKLQNSGKEAMMDLLDKRIGVAESTMANKLAAGVYADGTGYGGKELVGLGAAVVALPTTGTYGGIDRQTWTFWQNQYTGSLGAPTSTTIQGFMNALWVKQVRGKDRPDLILAPNNLYATYEASLQAQQRFVDTKTGDLGFPSIAYKDCPVVLDGGIGGNCPSSVMYFLNTNYIFLRPHKDRNMVSLDPSRRVSINQDAEVAILAWAGAFTTSNSSLQGYFQGS